jgi:hypothetical protein
MEETKEAVVIEQAPPATPEASTGSGSDPAALSAAVANFAKELKLRSFAGRNPELGKMIKCAVCRRRHRESVRCEQKFANKPGTPEGESNPMICKSKRYRPERNPFWRAHPGVTVYVKELKKYVRIVQ